MGKRFDFKKHGFTLDENKQHNEIALRRWKSMINRCYNENSSNYKSYGAKGIYISEEWKDYENFEKWFNNFYIEGYQIDKDIICESLNLIPKYYSEETCLFLSGEDNFKEKREREEKTFKNDINYHSRKPITHDNFLKKCKEFNYNPKDFYVIPYRYEYTREHNLICELDKKIPYTNYYVHI